MKRNSPSREKAKKNDRLESLPADVEAVQVHDQSAESTPPQARLAPGHAFLHDLLGQEILLVLQADQLNILGQTFRPIFCGKMIAVTDGFVTLDPVIIKMPNAPFHRFPTPLSFPIEKMSSLTPFDCGIRFSIT